MTSGQKSSNRGASGAPYAAMESLAGVFHPHAIEVQDFSYYAVVIDVRPRAEYDDDHIPGAVQVDPPTTTDESVAHAPPAHGNTQVGELPQALAAAMDSVSLDQAILIYCGAGGRHSQPLAQELRWRGWTVDVLAGGWINYRRWVQAGLEVLPRLLTFRAVACSLGGEAARVLRAFSDAGQQVLDIRALAGSSRGLLGGVSTPQPAQAWFESQLLQAIRRFDPRSPVWVEDRASRMGALAVPGALKEAMANAPVTTLQVPVAERVRCWTVDEPLLAADPSAVISALSALSPPPSQDLLMQLQRAAPKGINDLLLGRLLTECVDPAVEYGFRSAESDCRVMSPLKIESLAPNPMKAAVRSWLRTVALGPTAV